MLTKIRDLLAGRIAEERSEDWIACLDFGTAYSKMAMVLSESVKDLESGDILPLVIGERAFAGGFLLPSSIFVGETTIQFGADAQAAALRQAVRGRQALEAPKQYLSTLNLDEIDAPLPKAIDPTGTYTARKLISLYLALILFRAEKGARAAGLDWPPRLRIARPAWAPDRAAAGEAILKSMVRDAFMLADCLENALEGERGLPHSIASEALGAIEGDAVAPQAWERNVFALDRDGDAGVNEATAVAAATIAPVGRRIVVVADIGGGTSDFGAFMTGLAGSNVVAELTGSAQVLRQAGDHLDMLLRKYVLDQLGYLEDDPAGHAAAGRLKLRQRALKETLFNEGRVVAELVDELVEVTLEAFLAFPPVQRFAEGLRQRFSLALDEAISAADGYVPGTKLPVEIMRTGGGCDLPMVKALAEDPGRDWFFTDASPQLPAIRGDVEFARFAPQLAVAIGGAIRDLPKKTAPIRAHGAPRPAA